jgi:molybdenum cofactor cytidylyltransferase
VNDTGSTARGAVLILAAGRGRRFGSDKRRALLADGRPLLQASVEAAQAADLPCLLCLSSRDRDAPPFDGIQTHFASGADRGMGATLASAVAALGPQPWILVALGDMPWVTPQSLRAVAAAADRHRIVVPTYRGHPGHPVAFGADFLPLLQRLDGDRGARSVIDAHREAVVEIPLDDPGILRDVDRVSDLRDAMP